MNVVTLEGFMISSFQDLKLICFATLCFEPLFLNFHVQLYYGAVIQDRESRGEEKFFWKNLHCLSVNLHSYTLPEYAIPKLSIYIRHDQDIKGCNYLQLGTNDVKVWARKFV